MASEERGFRHGERQILEAFGAYGRFRGSTHMGRWWMTEKRLHHAQLPAPAAKEHGADQREGRVSDHDGEKDAERAEVEHARENERQGDLPQPEAEEVDPSGRPGIASAIEGLREHHAKCIKKEAVAHS